MSDLFALMGSMNTKLTGMDSKIEDLAVRVAVQEARMSLPRSRAPSREIFKELKTAASVEKVTDRTSLLVDFVSSEVRKRGFGRGSNSVTVEDTSTRRTTILRTESGGRHSSREDQKICAEAGVQGGSTDF